jgi:hypothetical protein
MPFEMSLWSLDGRDRGTNRTPKGPALPVLCKYGVNGKFTEKLLATCPLHIIPYTLLAVQILTFLRKQIQGV